MLQFLIFTIALPASHAAQGRPFNSAETVFATYTNYSDWAPGVAIPMTWFCAIWTNSAWVAPAYMAEETQDASKAAPKAIIESYVVTALMGTFICLLFAFCISDMDLIAADTTYVKLLPSTKRPSLTRNLVVSLSSRSSSNTGAYATHPSSF